MEIANGNFLITGGASLIGSYLAEQLLADGAAKVVIADNLSLGSLSQLAHLTSDPRLEIVYADILRIEKLLEYCRDIDGVFHVAGYLTLPLSKDLGHGIDVNVRGTLNVLETSRWSGVKKVVLSSSVAVYGNPDGETGEQAAFNRSSAGYSPAAAIYGATKIIGEHLAQLYTARHGLEHVNLRYASVYGARQHGRAVNALLLTNPIERLRANLPPQIAGDGSEAHDYIHVQDIARANLAAMASPVKAGSYTVGTGISSSLNDVVYTLLDLFGSSLKPEYTTEQREMTSAVSSNFRFDVSNAERDLGWKAQISLRDGLESLMRWYDENEKVDGASAA
ncbi:NAD-dependent epimerase/dehydratase family protein [Alcaligenaceae bacterium]|nr:NAD-dependent epimerase/dehydratase family protein [Alcaligenaceae bacterium]